MPIQFIIQNVQLAGSVIIVTLLASDGTQTRIQLPVSEAQNAYVGRVVNSVFTYGP